tara:strand:- start:976 stop:1485 length:510 start_codon:yes stop_codon:yes gene_type:complete
MSSKKIKKIVKQLKGASKMHKAQANTLQKMFIENTMRKGKKKGRCWKGYKPTPGKTPYSPGSCMKEGVYQRIYNILTEASPAWQRKAGKNPSGGLNKKGIASYRAANPKSKLSMAVTTKPSKLKKGGKKAKRRKSFCARMGGMKRRLTGAKTANNPDSRINKALRKWNC